MEIYDENGNVIGYNDYEAEPEVYFEPSDKLKEGTKYDTGKLRYDLVPPEALEEITKVITFGANKYADRNWEKGISWGRVFGATMRHLWAWWRGEDKDKETGLSHLAHAGCCIFFLLTYEQRKMNTWDDRRIK